MIKLRYLQKHMINVMLRRDEFVFIVIGKF